MSKYKISSIFSPIILIAFQLLIFSFFYTAVGQPNTSTRTLPKTTLGGGLIFIDRSNESLDFFGGDVHAHFYGRAWGNTDSAAGFTSDSWRTQLGGGVNVFVAFESDQDIKFTLSGVTAGPELRFSKGSFASVIFLQGGIVKDQIKFGDTKDHESGFGLRTGLSLEWWVGQKFAFQATPQALMTKFDDKADWNFAAGFGAIFKISSWK